MQVCHNSYFVDTRKTGQVYTTADKHIHSTLQLGSQGLKFIKHCLKLGPHFLMPHINEHSPTVYHKNVKTYWALLIYKGTNLFSANVI